MPDRKIAVVTGCTGQDGSYLLELLLEKDYQVVGVRRRSSVDNIGRIRHLKHHPNLTLIEGDVTDITNVNSWFADYQPDECYNLAAQSHVGTSFKLPALTWRVNAEGVINVLEGIRNHSPHTRLYQASTSEMFGKNYSCTYDLTNCMREINRHQNEQTPFAPQSPYGVAKVAAHQSVQMYRRAYGIHASCGILFNHESERRGEQFLTRKVTRWLGDLEEWKYRMSLVPYETPKVILGEIIRSESPELTFECNGDNIQCLESGEVKDTFPKLRLGNLDAKRDWGHAADYVRAMWMMLQQNEPDNYIVSTGETHSVEEFVQESFKVADLPNYKDFIVQDPEFMRPAEVDYLLGDSTKIREKLGWKPEISFKNLVNRMVSHDINND